MGSGRKRSPLRIPEVLDLRTGRYLSATSYLCPTTDRERDAIHAMRRPLIKAKRTGEPFWVCPMCHEPVWIGGGEPGLNHFRYHFRHFRDARNCPYQDAGLPKDVLRRIKYNGAKESELHRLMKRELAHHLESDPRTSPPVAIEQTFFLQDGGRRWRRPDISCTWNGLPLVLEIQISSDFLDVIQGREEDYHREGVFLLWVFAAATVDRFYAKDIYVGNQKNVFVYDQRLKALSEAAGHLVLECHFKRPVLQGTMIEDVWEKRDVSLGELTFDGDRRQVFYHDYEQAEAALLQQQLLAEFDAYWSTTLPHLVGEPADRLQDAPSFEARFQETYGIPLGWERSRVAKVLSTLYVIRDTPPGGETATVAHTHCNLVHLVNTIADYRRPYFEVVALALYAYGHKDAFDQRAPFKKKVELFRRSRAQGDPGVQRDRTYDPLFALLFPQLRPHLVKPLSPDP